MGMEGCGRRDKTETGMEQGEDVGVYGGGRRWGLGKNQ